ncbi:ABATE domain-containing protein [Saccharomonospora xinjiangensis]|uniref:CGNR zinc finger domain-containing protein n=1 Tax=Saccharomonospora xinjiangensis TaxID=75294 RepID=UPI0010C5071F|nr:ABATE domain-containing protein [Saccharomonospora xinjiangensis]QBQ61861.1 CGNR zinc finger [Saccharomonospora xinjiangensis]
MGVIETAGREESAQERADAPEFRLDNERLAFRFTATLTDRGGARIERLPTPRRLDDWLAANDLVLADAVATVEDLALAHRLREAIHRAGSAIASELPPGAPDTTLINSVAGDSGVYPQLTPGGMRWRTRSDRPVRAALGIIAIDAVSVLGGDERRRVKACENPACTGLFVDTSRARSRRWCSMNFCGNRAKKARFRGRSDTREGP